MAKTKKAQERKTKWVVRAFTVIGPSRTTVKNGITTTTPENGWKDIKEFDSPTDADDWLCSYVRGHGYSITDFNIVRRMA